MRCYVIYIAAHYRQCYDYAMYEKWRPVIGHPRHLISSYGRVYSLINRRVLKQSNAGRYPTIELDGKTYALHRLVAKTFIGPRPKGHVVCHGDGNSFNCILSNLRYGTQKENEADKDRHGNRHRGEQSTSSKLTWAQVNQIRQRYRNGETQRALATAFGTSKTNVAMIVNNVTWVV